MSEQDDEAPTWHCPESSDGHHWRRLYASEEAVKLDAPYGIECMCCGIYEDI